MNGTIARDQIQVGLRANTWTALLAKMEDPFKGVQGGFNVLGVTVYSDFLSGANTELKFQQSDDGVAWDDVTVYNDVVPGGFIAIQGQHTMHYCRFVGRSTANARLWLTVARPNPSENPALWPDEGSLWIY